MTNAFCNSKKVSLKLEQKTIYVVNKVMATLVQLTKTI